MFLIAQQGNFKQLHYKMDKRVLLTIFLLAVTLSCKKEEIVSSPILLSEIIYGDWEIRESISYLDYRDFELHSLNPPYPYYRFYKTGEYEVWYLDTPTTITAPFIVNNQDSTIRLNKRTINVVTFSEEMIEMIWDGGRTGERLYRKVE